MLYREFLRRAAWFCCEGPLYTRSEIGSTRTDFEALKCAVLEARLVHFLLVGIQSSDSLGRHP